MSWEWFFRGIDDKRRRRLVMVLGLVLFLVGFFTMALTQSSEIGPDFRRVETALWIRILYFVFVAGGMAMIFIAKLGLVGLIASFVGLVCIMTGIWVGEKLAPDHAFLQFTGAVIGAFLGFIAASIAASFFVGRLGED